MTTEIRDDYNEHLEKMKTNLATLEEIKKNIGAPTGIFWMIKSLLFVMEYTFYMLSILMIVAAFMFNKFHPFKEILMANTDMNLTALVKDHFLLFSRLMILFLSIIFLTMGLMWRSFRKKNDRLNLSRIAINDMVTAHKDRITKINKLMTKTTELPTLENK